MSHCAVNSPLFSTVLRARHTGSTQGTSQHMRQLITLAVFVTPCRLCLCSHWSGAVGIFVFSFPTALPDGSSASLTQAGNSNWDSMRGELGKEAGEAAWRGVRHTGISRQVRSPATGQHVGRGCGICTSRLPLLHCSVWAGDRIQQSRSPFSSLSGGSCPSRCGRLRGTPPVAHPPALQCSVHRGPFLQGPWPSPVLNHSFLPTVDSLCLFPAGFQFSTQHLVLLYVMDSVSFASQLFPPTPGSSVRTGITFCFIHWSVLGVWNSIRCIISVY